jgi:putative Holliday junction resolvase
VDVGTVRVGVAGCDPEGVIATPLATLARDPRGDADLDEIARLAREYEVVEVVVGDPTRLSGSAGAAAEAARAYAVLLARRVAPVGVRLVDERLSTTAAHRRLREAGVGGRRRRPVIDRAAAVLILQTALDAERASGIPPGSLVDPGTGPEGPAPGRREGGAR